MYHVTNLFNQNYFTIDWMKQRNVRIKEKFKLIALPEIPGETEEGKTHRLILF